MTTLTHILATVAAVALILLAEAIREWWLVGRSIDQERGSYNQDTHSRSQFRGQESTH